MQKASPWFAGGGVAVVMGSANLMRAKGPATVTVSVVFILLGLGLLALGSGIGSHFLESCPHSGNRQNGR